MISFENIGFTKPKEKDLSPESVVEQVNELEASIGTLSDRELQGKTTEFSHRLTEGKTLDEILPEAFAVVREVSKRTLGMRHYDSQIAVGLSLHKGNMAEMMTGEGKTLAATLAVYLNALTGKGVHIMSSNDHLASRDAKWMATIYDFLGLTSGVLQGATAENDQPSFLVEKGEGGDYYLKETSRQEAYLADITYGTISQFGFDYLRDSMALDPDEVVQRGHNFAVFDEADSVLVDEASTPLFLSGEMDAAEAADYRLVSQAVAGLQTAHYELNTAERSVELTESGTTYLSEILRVELVNPNLEEIFNPESIQMWGLVQQALDAEFLYHINKDYIKLFNPKTKQEQIVIISEGGRSMFGRSWSDGLHQAIEAKEGLPISAYDRTYESTTVQSYARKYAKRAGMTGSALGLEEELWKFYEMEVDEIPPRKESQRVDGEDLIYWDEESKLAEIRQDVIESRQQGIPVLLGTSSIIKSQQLDGLLEEANISPRQLLNAHFHDEEAEIIKKAGECHYHPDGNFFRGAVTVATNMAGRGTDIKLGGEDAAAETVALVKQLGGLRVIGETRNRSQRLDIQLKGRAGRQGEPGSSQFYVSLEDELLVNFSQQSSELADFMAENKDKKGLITGKDREKVLSFIKAAQDRIAGDGFAHREKILDYSQITERHREAFAKHKLETMTQEEPVLDTKLKSIIENELKRRVEPLKHRRGQEVSSHQVSGVLNWLEMTQSTVDRNGEIQPSFGLDLFVQEAMKRVGVDSIESLTVANSLEVESTFVKMKQELIENEKKEALKIIEAKLMKLDLNKPAEVDSFNKQINLLLPGRVDVDVRDAYEWMEIPVKSENDEQKKAKILVVDREFLLENTLDQVADVFDGQLDVEQERVAISEYLMLGVRGVFEGAGGVADHDALKKQLLQSAKEVFAPEGQIKSSHWWMIQDAVRNVHPNELTEQVTTHLEEVWAVNEEDWSADVFDEDGQLLERVDAKRQALLLARSLSWTEYLSKIEELQLTIELEAQSGGDILNTYNTKVNKIFEEMLQKSEELFVQLIFESQQEIQIPDGELTPAGSYKPAVILERVIAIKDKYPNAEIFSQHINLIQRAIMAEKGHVDTRRLFIQKIEQESDFIEELLKVVDRQIATFLNDFKEKESRGADVAFSTLVTLPDKIRGWDGEMRALSAEERTIFIERIQQLTQHRALQQRFKIVLGTLQDTEDKDIVDPFEGIVQNEGGLVSKIRSLDLEIEKIASKLWSYLE
ncbi:MAG: hypothetical protein HN846_03135 [Candidatus Pacebacteria bacterium]|jgi:preprotein translocase subunit SecA|nr:hypothetical protein [Candidatus Paceibacterota bacterium]MBT4005093.1 hypothetical protein [Candidatus Paceibacterota bacterium]MBT4358926.1 hypothetical protein [Candidatus Paceibacterota bacterium]MBT4680795.1 hypothetical protein [Candidatus Paceibacterota bacterium]MBT6898774.1 hypothetical protein [Candidatus Paceibacterota bacterium]